jgi:hypothetical protein
MRILYVLFHLLIVYPIGAAHERRRRRREVPAAR